MESSLQSTPKCPDPSPGAIAGVFHKRWNPMFLNEVRRVDTQTGADMTTIDVDFSGAIKNQDTWFAQGHLDQDGQLQLERVHPVRREDLYDLMLEIPVPAVAALDFPFGVPGDFVEHIAEGKPLKAINEVWPVLVCGGRTWFDCQQDKFVKAHEEVRRSTEDVYMESKKKRRKRNSAPSSDALLVDPSDRNGATGVHE